MATLMVSGRIGVLAALAAFACIGMARGELSGVTGQGGQVQVRPTNEAASEPTLRAVLAALVPVLGSRRLDALRPFMAPDLRTRQAFCFEPERGDVYWRELEQLLALGGTFTTTRGVVPGRREFCAPYVYSAYPWPVPPGYGSEVDPSVLLEADVAVHASPSSTSPVLARLSYALVREVGGGYPGDGRPGPTWSLVILQDDREGYVLDSQIRSPTDYHACFAQIEGRWQMVRFARDITPTGPVM